MSSRKAQAGIPMHYLIILIVSVMAVGVVIYAAVKSETTRKLAELPGFEDKTIDETVEVPDACPVKVGYFSKRTEDFPSISRYLWIRSYIGSANTYSYASLKIGNDLLPTQIFYLDNKLYLDTESGDIQIGVLEGRAGKYELSFYCDWESKVKGKETYSTSLNELKNGFFIEGFTQQGQIVLCRENRSYGIFECAGGDLLKKSFDSMMISQPLSFMQRQTTPNIVCPNVPARLRGEFSLIDWTYSSPYEAGGETINPRLNLEFVWDECRNQSIIISYSSFALAEELQTKIFRKEDVSTGSLGVQTEEIVNKILKINGKDWLSVEIRAGVSEGIAVYIKNIMNAKNLTDFADQITEFTSYYCANSKDKAFKKLGWSNFWQGTFSNQNCEQQTLEQIKSTFWKSEANYACCDYQCLIDGKMQQCKQVNGNFCLNQNNKKCVSYELGDKFAFYDPVSGGIYGKTLTEKGLK